ncbi:MAG: DUF2306 domain-containing protein [Mariniphaga sp.]
MKPATTIKTSTAAFQYIFKGLYVILAIVTFYYIYTRALTYYKIDNAIGAYGTKAIFIIIHVTLGITATIIGPFQFIESFRLTNLKRHRLIGKIYLLSTIISALISWYIVLPATHSGSLAYKGGLFFLGFIWIASAVMAYLSIKNKKIELHKEWMTRSYVITIAFVTFRLVEDLLVGMDFKGTSELMAWACWAVPLFITEVILQGRKIKK